MAEYLLFCTLPLLPCTLHGIAQTMHSARQAQFTLPIRPSCPQTKNTPANRQTQQNPAAKPTLSSDDPVHPREKPSPPGPISLLLLIIFLLAAKITMSILSSIFELPWTRQIRQLTDRLTWTERERASLEAENQTLDRLNERLELDLDRARSDLRQSEQSEATLRGIKQQLEVSDLEKKKMLAVFCADVELCCSERT